MGISGDKRVKPLKRESCLYGCLARRGESDCRVNDPQLDGEDGGLTRGGE